MELNDEDYEKITELCEEGDELLEEDKFDRSIQKYKEALELVPLPKQDWEASTWIYTALGEACYFKGDYQQGKEYLYEAMNCPDGEANPLILLRMGEVLYECEEKEKAKEYLLRTYMLEGYEIFKDEDEKYFQLIIDII